MENKLIEESETPNISDSIANYEPTSYFPHNRDYASTAISQSGFSRLELTAEEVQKKKKELLRIIEHEEARRKTQRTKILVSLAIAVAILTILSKRLGHLDFSSWIGVVFAFSGITAAISAKQRQAAVELTQFDDISLTGTLIEQLQTTDKPALAAIQKALTKLLLRFEDRDSHLLSKDQIGTLLQRLKINNTVPDPETTLQFRLAILKAMKHLANEQALAAIEAIGRGEDAGKYFPELVLAAQESLPEIRVRVARLKESNTLLRASAPELSPSNELLRPASGVGKVEEDKLLRPSHSPIEAVRKE